MALPEARYVASLPWYDLEELRPATDGFWSILARHLIDKGIAPVPTELERTQSFLCQWESPHFLFGQACGYDALLAYRDHLRVVATPHYEAPGCDGPLHCSFIVVLADSPYHRLSDLRGTRCTFNNLTSHSGRNALRRVVAPHHDGGHFFSSVHLSGSHEGSLAGLHAGIADVASIDCVTYALLARARPASVAGTRIIMRTAPVPAPPYVTNATVSQHVVDLLRDALAESLDELGTLADQLLLTGIEVLPIEAYEPIAEMEKRAAELGYFELDVQRLAGGPPAPTER